ncbi:Sodium/hydrogen exchanger family-domain-containing protein [Gautieria morchelliformis]|nr:Sodium/hydrogen exchanger family-domain-containing protein [Gautieria morchelliformis]
MGVLSRELQDVVDYVKRAAPEQGGIISGANPSAWNSTDPFPLWVIQVFIIICFTQLLAIPLARIRQPRVIAEVIGGILLGPTVMGRIPNFTNSIFPTLSKPLLTLTSTVGLVLFLFLVGLEIDVRVLKGNAKYSLTISAVGMVLPFGLGVGLAVALYHQFSEPTVNFGHFLLFVGVAVAITAFPVLCRILTDLDLLNDHIGVIVLSAGVGNDVVGWILLALAVALTNASSGLTALWILLAGTGFVLFMLYPVRWAFIWLARHTGSLENGSPTPLMMTVTLLVILTSAFFTDVIGIHPIFGGFLAGIIVPHEGGFAIALVEKLEDLVTIVFLPLYFVLSGLNTNLGLLNNGISWGYIVLICTIAFLGKFIGCAFTAKFLGFSYRESGAIGTLMSCKGLVELIVLNIGLQAGILDTRLFSMFVVHALVLTIMTTPLTLWFYPPAIRTGRKGGIQGTGGARNEDDLSGSIEENFKTKFSVVLNRIEHLPAIMTITQLLQPLSKTLPTPIPGSGVLEKAEKAELSRDITQEKQVLEESSTSSSVPITHPRVSIEALRLIELTDRTSAVMRSSEADDLIHRDALITVFSTFGRLNRIPVATSLSIVSQDAFSTSVATHARDTGAQLVVVPWHSGNSNVLTEEQGSASPETPGTTYNPFDGIFGKGSSPDRTSSVVYANFVRKVFSESPADVALFVDRGGAAPRDQHIFLPFFGGPDDRLALRFVVQLCANPDITATVVRMTKTSGAALKSTESNDTEIPDKAREAINALTMQSATGFPDTIYAAANTATRMASDTADNILWSRFAHPNPASTVPLTPQTQGALSRVAFSETSSPMPLRSVIQRAAGEAKTASDSWKSLLLVVGRGRRLAAESHHDELDKLISEQAHTPVSGDVTRTIGEVAAGFVVAGTNVSGILVMQSTHTSS